MHPDSNAPAQPMERDAQMHHDAMCTVNEAAERATFHRIELERWERIGRAAGATVHELNAQLPVPETTGEDFLSTGHPQLTSSPAGAYVG